MEKGELIMSRRARGREIFRIYLQKYIASNYSSQEEESYIRSLVEASDFHPHMFDTPIPRWKFYVPLEKAERTGGKVVLVPNKNDEKETESGGWAYSIKVQKSNSRQLRLSFEH